MPRFEEFSREDSRAGRGEPMFTLQARGLISLNHAAFLALERPEAVALLYDADEAIVAMRKVAKTHPNAYSVRKMQQSQSYLVGAQGFTAHYEIPTQRARRFPGRDYGNGAWGFALREGVVVQNRRGRKAGPAVTERWRQTTDGFEVPELMRITHVGMSHPGYMRRDPGAKPPSLRVGMLVACSPLGPAPATSELRSRFLSFLDWAPIMGLITELSHVDAGFSWTPWGGHGRINVEAVLTGENDEEAPAASALLLLPEIGTSRYGRDSRYAELVLDIEPRSPDGSPAAPGGLAAWHGRFTRALNLPAVLARFLSDELGLIPADDPPAQAGVWLNASRSMSELIDVGQLKPVKGAMGSNQFMGWAVADPGGDPAEATAVDWLTQMCDHTLHLDGYEPVLERMRQARKDELQTGEQLLAGHSLFSSDGRFRLDVEKNGNLIVRWGRKTIWKSDTARTRGAYYLALQDDGNLVLRNADDISIWSTETAGRGGKNLIMQTDGNLVLYSDNGPVWHSGIVVPET
jgi:hypothetical protein